MDFKELGPTTDLIPGELYADTNRTFLSKDDTIMRCHSVTETEVFFDKIEWNGSAGYEADEKGLYTFDRLHTGFWLHVRKEE